MTPFPAAAGGTATIPARLLHVAENTFDLKLFQQLNDEFREQPLIEKPPERTSKGAEAVAQRRIQTITRHVDVTDKVVLELGTGRGYTAAMLPVVAGAKQVIGVDIKSYADWDEHDRTRTDFIVGDLASDNLLDPESVDVVVSAVVFEHVTRPIQMLAQLYRALTEGGEAWLYFNLYRGPAASHRYHHVFFPWPHLLFDSIDPQQMLEATGARKFAWVNYMTAATYLQTCAELGFEITLVRRHAAQLERFLPFYVRFEEKLGRYPALDLETDFLTLVLRKQNDPIDRAPRLGYHERQQAFDALVAQYRGGS